MVKYIELVKMVLDDLLSRGDVVLTGNCIATPGFCDDLERKYGWRVFDYPLSEASNSGFAVGLSLAGMKAILFFARFDFALYAMSGIVNDGVYWSRMHGLREERVNVTIWIKLKRGGGAQHSCSYESWFAHLPGVKVIAPSDHRTVMGAFYTCYEEPGVKLILDSYKNWATEADVELRRDRLPLKARVLEEGSDVTVVGYSDSLFKARRICDLLRERGFDPELIDLVWLKPMDYDTLERSVRKTGRLIMVDNSWRWCGIGAEVLAALLERGVEFEARRVALPEYVYPASTRLLEKFMMWGVEDAVEICRKMLESEIHYIRKLEKEDAIRDFEYFMEFFTKAISIALTELDFGEWGFQTMNYLCEFMKKTDSIEVANIVAFQLYDLINFIKRKLEHENVESLDNITSHVVIFLEKQLEMDPRSFLKRFSDHYEWLSFPLAEAWCRFFAMHEEPIIKALKSPDICFDILDISPQFSDLFLKHKIFRDVITETLRSLNPSEFFRRLENIWFLDNDIIIEITREKIAASSFDDIIVLIDVKGKWCLKNDYIRDALNNIKFGPQKIDVDDIKRAIYKEKYVSILLEFDWFVDCIISNIRTFDATTLIKMLELHVWRKQLPERLIKTIIESLASRILKLNEEDAIKILRSIPNQILGDYNEIYEALVRKLSGQDESCRSSNNTRENFRWQVVRNQAIIRPFNEANRNF